jgi:hypothetical protein
MHQLKGNTMNLSLIWKFVSAATTLLPTAIGVATAIQNAFPDSPGAAKMEMVKSGIAAVIAAEGTAVTEFETLWPHVQPLLSGIIQVLKTHKLAGFVPSASPAASPAAASA